jgi:hypothetical protein
MSDNYQIMQQRAIMGGAYAASPFIGLGQAFTVTTEDLIKQSAALRALIVEYDEHDISVPKQLVNDLADLGKRIARSHLAEQEAKLRTIEQEIEHLRSNEEKKKAKEVEAAELRKALGRA